MYTRRKVWEFGFVLGPKTSLKQVGREIAVEFVLLSCRRCVCELLHKRGNVFKHSGRVLLDVFQGFAFRRFVGRVSENSRAVKHVVASHVRLRPLRGACVCHLHKVLLQLVMNGAEGVALSVFFCCTVATVQRAQRFLSPIRRYDG